MLISIIFIFFLIYKKIIVIVHSSTELRIVFHFEFCVLRWNVLDLIWSGTPADCVSLALSGALFSWSKPLLVSIYMMSSVWLCIYILGSRNIIDGLIFRWLVELIGDQAVAITCKLLVIAFYYSYIILFKSSRVNFGIIQYLKSVFDMFTLVISVKLYVSIFFWWLLVLIWIDKFF